MIVNITARPKVLFVVITREFSLETAKRNFVEIINSVEEHRSEKILIDGRTVTGRPEVIERFYYGEFAADAVRQLRERAGLGKNPQFAYVLHEPVLDPHRLGETVAVNRGMNIKVFDNCEEALDWLGLEREDVGDI